MTLEAMAGWLADPTLTQGEAEQYARTSPRPDRDGDAPGHGARLPRSPRTDRPNPRKPGPVPFVSGLRVAGVA